MNVSFYPLKRFRRQTFGAFWAIAFWAAIGIRDSSNGHIIGPTINVSEPRDDTPVSGPMQLAGLNELLHANCK